MEDFDQEKIKQFYIDLWKSRKRSGMSHSGKAWDERSAGWVRELSDDSSAARRSRNRVLETAKYLREHGLLTESDNVIDIGCGPGRFVAEFAKTAEKVTGIDISPQMCRYGQMHSESLGLDNTEFIPCDFGVTDIDSMGWRESFDLVFSSITPAMSSYESLRKAEMMSRKSCFQSNYIKAVDTLNDEVLAEVIPSEYLTHKRGIMSFYILLNILLLEGKRPVTAYYSETEDQYVPVDDTLVENAFKFVSASIKEEYFEKVREAMLKKADRDGNVSIHKEWHYGWILWDVR